MKLLLTTFLLFLLANLTAQITLNQISIKSGATYTKFDGLFDFSPTNHKPLWSYFVGGVSQLNINSNENRFMELGVMFRNVQTKRRNEVIKLNETALHIGPSIKWKKLTFNLNTSLIYVIAKEKASNAPAGLGFDLSSVENFYATLSGKIEFRIMNRISLFVEQSFLNTRVYKFYYHQRGEILEESDYPRWTLLGVSYNLLPSPTE